MYGFDWIILIIDLFAVLVLFVSVVQRSCSLIIRLLLSIVLPKAELLWISLFLLGLKCQTSTAMFFFAIIFPVCEIQLTRFVIIFLRRVSTYCIRIIMENYLRLPH